MQRTNTARYDAVAMTVHWVTAALMIFMVFFGEDLIKSEGGEAAATAGAALPSLHVTIGITILILTLLRILWRIGHRAPPYPASMKRYEVAASHALHGLFYVLLLGLPLTGWLAFGSFAGRHPEVAGAAFYWLVPVPQVDAGGIFGDIHALGSNLAIALIALHVLAALKHRFIDRDGIMGRMLPF